MNPKARTKVVPTSFRITEEARRLLAELAAALGLSQAGVIEVLVRERAKKEGVK